MPYAELAATRINIAADFRDNELVKQVPGAKWDEDVRTWWVPLSWAACVQLRGVLGTELQVGPDLAAWAQADRAARIDRCVALRMAEDAPELQFLSALYPYQRAGVQFLVTAGQALIADEMGLGKSAQTIAALEVIGDSAYPAIVICPNSMKFTWSDEFKRWAPTRRVSVIQGTAVKRRTQIAAVRDGEADVAVINYEGLRAHTRLAGYGSLTLTEPEKQEKELNEIEFSTVVADEAHRAKDPRSKQTRALWWLGDRATRRYALTGTPIANSPEDIWTLMRFVSPSEFPAKTRFIDRYAMQSYNYFGFMETVGMKPETKDELFKILDPRFIRRLKAAVLPQLPEKTYSTRYVELAAKQRRAYNELRKEMMTQLETGTLMASNPLSHAVRLLQFASAYGEIVGEDLRLTEPSCKVDALEELVAELGDQQAVVFAESRQLIELAAARMGKLKIPTAQITGSVSPFDRQANVTRFQQGEFKLLLLTLGAGGEGLTLTAASTAIFLQRSFSLVKNLQAEDRIHRLGQEASAVNVIDVVSTDTIESRVHAVRAEKADQLEQLVRDQETLRQWLAK